MESEVKIVYLKDPETNQVFEVMEDAEVFNKDKLVPATKEEHQEFRLPFHKAQMLREATEFFQNLRYFDIKKNNIVIAKLKAESSLTDGIQSWINEIENTERETYNYFSYEFTLTQCKNLLGYVSMLRNKCATLQTYYCGGFALTGAIEQVKSYKELQSFNYKTDPETKKIIDNNFFSPFILE